MLRSDVKSTSCDALDVTVFFLLFTGSAFVCRVVSRQDRSTGTCAVFVGLNGDGFVDVAKHLSEVPRVDHQVFALFHVLSVYERRWDERLGGKTLVPVLGRGGVPSSVRWRDRRLVD